MIHDETTIWHTEQVISDVSIFLVSIATNTDIQAEYLVNTVYGQYVTSQQCYSDGTILLYCEWSI